MALKHLIADLTIDTVCAYVVRRHGASKVHRTIFDGTTANPVALCGTRARGEWRVVSAEFTVSAECKNCQRMVANMTHGSKING